MPNKKKSASTSFQAQARRWRLPRLWRKQASAVPESRLDSLPLIKPLSQSQPVSEPVAPTDEETRICPKCSGRMVRMVAVYGTNAGSEFWGCASFPGCTGVIWI